MTGSSPRLFGRVHAQWKTPWFGTIITSLLAIVVIVLSVTVDSSTPVFSNLILDIGILVALYYGVTGVASAWAFRKVLTSSVRLFVFAGVLPLLSGLFLFYIAYYVIQQDFDTSKPDPHHDRSRHPAPARRGADQPQWLLPREDGVVRAQGRGAVGGDGGPAAAVSPCAHVLPGRADGDAER